MDGSIEATRGRSRERGLALVDVLVGVAIFAVLAVIAMTVWHQYRVRAYEAAALSDAKNVGEALLGGADARGINTSEGVVVLATFRPRTDLSTITDPLTASKQSLTKGNRLVDWAVIGRNHFAFCIEHVSGEKVDAFAAFRSDKGGIYAHGRYDGCPDLPGEGGGPSDDSDDPTPSPTDSPSSTPSPSSGPTDSPSSGTPSPSPTESTSTPPAAAPWLSPAPTSAEDIEDLCNRDWGSRAIRGAHPGTIYGTSGDDVIYAGNQDQTIYGLGGNDLICGGNGKDTLYGGAGNDVLYGGNGKDTLYGGADVDYLHGNNGKDTLYVGDGFADLAYGGNGKDIYLEDGPGDPTPEDSFVEAGPNG